ncbi:hypothetical protein MUP65_00780 [Patescibacteria group bacterium]|nr:hypothetical protein [Patescibacteria group bacterium]
MKVIKISLSLIVIILLGLVIAKLTLFPDLGQSETDLTEPDPEPNGNGLQLIVGPVSQYATHSAVIKIEQLLNESEQAFKEVKLREDSYLLPRIDLNVDL